MPKELLEQRIEQANARLSQLMFLAFLGYEEAAKELERIVRHA